MGWGGGGKDRGGGGVGTQGGGGVVGIVEGVGALDGGGEVVRIGVVQGWGHLGEG